MKPMEQESEWIRRAQQGNLVAFDAIFRHYESVLYNYFFRFVNRKEDAQDLAQETFFKVYRFISSYDSKRSFATWLFTIATRTAFDWLRRQRRLPESLTIDDTDAREETIGDSFTYTSIESKIDVERALNQISPMYKTVLLLYYFERFQYEEIAQILDVPINTVKTRIARAKLALRQTLR